MTAAHATVVALALVGQVQTHGPGRAARQRLVQDFMSAMAGEGEPTIADFKKYFGPHNEEEIILQVRFEGQRDPFSGSTDPSDPVVKRVNHRLQHPERYPSLFLRCARRYVPALTPAVAATVKPDEIRAERGGIVRVTTPGGALTFEFPDIEWYFGVASGTPARPVSATQFLGHCRTGSCCE